MATRVSQDNKNRYVFRAFPNEKKVRKGYSSYRNHKTEKADTFTSIKVAAGAAAGAALPILYFLKKRDGKLKGIKQFF